MINLKKIEPLNNEFMEKIGFAWHIKRYETH